MVGSHSRSAAGHKTVVGSRLGAYSRQKQSCGNHGAKISHQVTEMKRSSSNFVRKII